MEFMSLRKSKIPAELKPLLPRGGRNCVPLYFADQDLWLFADPSGLIRRDSEVTRWEWHEVQQIGWDRDTDTLSVTWPDPGKAPLLLKNPESTMLKSFGDHARVYLQKSQIYTQFSTLPSGTKVRIAVRAKADGSRFSEVVAFGALAPSDLSALSSLESQVRDMAGLPA